MNGEEYRDLLIGTLTAMEQAGNFDEFMELYNSLGAKIEMFQDTPTADLPELAHEAVNRVNYEVSSLLGAATEVSFWLLRLASEASGRPTSEILRDLALAWAPRKD